MNSSGPRIFISYTHENDDHKGRVRELACRLRSEGFNCHIDTDCEEDAPAKGWPVWMQEQIENADLVLIVCSEAYDRAFRKDTIDTGKGSVWEGSLITQELYDQCGHNSKFIPVGFESHKNAFPYIPKPLRSTTFFCVSDSADYQKLCKRLRSPNKTVSSTLDGPPPFSANLWGPKTGLYVPPPSFTFTGRSKQLSDLCNGLRDFRRVALWGLGGVGKTELAAAYCGHYRNHYDILVWLRGESEEAFLSDAIAAGLLKPPARTDPGDAHIDQAGEFRTALANNLAMLVVVDNVQDFAFLGRYIPSSEGAQVLITTQTRDNAGVATPQPVEPMDANEGALLLLRRAQMMSSSELLAAAQPEDVTAAREIANEVGGLPLALDQAGAYIAAVSCSPEHYLTLYRSVGTALRDRRGTAGGEVHPSVRATFTLAFQKLEGLSALGGDLIRLASFMEASPIPKTVFEALLRVDLDSETEIDPHAILQFDEGLAAIHQFSLLHPDDSLQSMTVHRLVQEVIHDEMSSDDKATWAGRATQCLSIALPAPDLVSQSESEFLPHALKISSLITRYKLEGEAAFYVPYWVAYRLIRTGAIGAAMRYTAQALEIAEAAPSDKEQLVAALLLQGEVLRWNGSYTESEAAQRRLIDLLVDGEDNTADMAQALNMLAVALEGQGRYTEALFQLEKARAIADSVAADSNLQATIYQNLAQSCRFTGDFDSAVQNYERALAMRKKLWGGDHELVGITLWHFGNCRRQQKRFAEAVELTRRASSIFERRLGPHHILVAMGLKGLGDALTGAGEHEEAEAILLRADSLFATLKATGHPAYAELQFALACLYKSMERPNWARPLYCSAIGGMAKTLGHKHPTFRYAVAEYVDFLLRQNECIEAAQLVRLYEL